MASGAAGQQQEALGTLWLHSAQGHVPSSRHRALKAHTASRLSALTTSNVLLNWGLGRSLVAFLLLKVFKQYQMSWYDRGPCAQSWSSRVL